jgi:hypothetical protein
MFHIPPWEIHRYTPEQLVALAEHHRRMMKDRDAAE